MTEFLERDGTNTRYELVDGEIVAMNPSLAPHARLVTVIEVALERRLPRGCGTYIGGGTVLAGDDRNYRIPDLAVSCTPRTGWGGRNSWLRSCRGRLTNTT